MRDEIPRNTLIHLRACRFGQSCLDRFFISIRRIGFPRIFPVRRMPSAIHRQARESRLWQGLPLSRQSRLFCRGGISFEWN
ncbi:hypothetical protein Bamb_1287 [Burkholderia ambifaria AMMD]|uniref:Uncharacterized protein n=1 Tax=Burkholderia ambifaria (strain ATCC BAA-244 / DSM 16087 / CCUG 44356 / LMG 19182 / AMMD) TaxID=339670 RepID=Q0BG78_BURCM|nr:hypothetical protein Bamb_1287 [Burkholderia ambifaria AMMD]